MTKLRSLFLIALSFGVINNSFATSKLFGCFARLVSLEKKPTPPPADLDHSPLGLNLYDNVTLARFQKNIQTLKAQGGPLLSIVIPAYKESARIGASIEAIKTFLDKFELAAEVIVVVQNVKADPHDATFRVATEAVGGDGRFVIDYLDSNGKGLAVRHGMQKARGNYIFFMDADLSTPLVETLKFLSQFALDPATKVLVGSRKEASSYLVNRGVIRAILSEGWIHLRNILVGLDHVTDTQCGFKAFTREAAQEIFSRQTINGFMLDVEILLLAEALHFHVTELLVHWQDEPVHSTVGVLDPLKMFLDMLKVRHTVHKSMHNQPKAEGPRRTGTGA